MRSPRIGVLALQGDVPEHLRAVQAAGARPQSVRRAEDLVGLHGLVLPGGESTVIGELLDYYELIEPIREQIGAGMGVYGSCAGMILLADDVLAAPAGRIGIGGIDMTVRRNAFGRQVDSFETEIHAPEFSGNDEDPDRPLRGVFIRAPWVERAGPEVQVLARVGSGPAAGRIVAVRQGLLMATSFHPEISSDLRVHRTFTAMVARPAN